METNFWSVVISIFLSFGSNGISSITRAATASTRSAWHESSSTFFRTFSLSSAVSGTILPSGVVQESQSLRMKFGAPLTFATKFGDFPSVKKGAKFFSATALEPCAFLVSQTVSIILREDEKGTSNTLGSSGSKSLLHSPTFPAATIIGASEELPYGTHFVVPSSGSVSSSTRVLQHNTAEARVLTTPGEEAALSPFSAYVILPSVGLNPFPVISKSCPEAHILTIVIFPSVRVPVLSVQITDAHPRVSTAAIRRTRTFFLTISEHPVLSEIVTHNGIPSGIAATAKVTAIRIMYNQGSDSGLSRSFTSSATPMMNTIKQTTIAKIPILTPKS
mmetsp:Transcript_13613/g.16507  ORF Transcript_13613/g.16507 Transcript_13613/m.16507 type:complete len:333 (+) Transcript_13613:2387-3385(+)